MPIFNATKDNISKAAHLIQMGDIVAFPTETVYGLGADSFNANAVRKIFAAKGRPVDNPLISHIARIEELERFSNQIPDSAIKLSEAFWGGPLTMIFKKQTSQDSVKEMSPTVYISAICKVFLG